jgi:hypothetical protein
MSALMNVYLNTTRNGLRIPDADQRRAQTVKVVKLFLAKNASTGVSDSMVPDYLVDDLMIERFLAIEPPIRRSTVEFDSIIEEIERSYVLGLFFSALSASVVTIERMLNTARRALHPLSSPKIAKLWSKRSTKEWGPNIHALSTWRYISEDLATELTSLYEVRCRYLHTGDISTLANDSLRSVNAAYRLLNELIGFPSRLFRDGTSGLECIAPFDPVVRIFYVPIPPKQEGTM